MRIQSQSVLLHLMHFVDSLDARICVLRHTLPNVWTDSTSIYRFEIRHWHHLDNIGNYIRYASCVICMKWWHALCPAMKCLSRSRNFRTSLLFRLPLLSLPTVNADTSPTGCCCERWAFWAFCKCLCQSTRPASPKTGNRNALSDITKTHPDIADGRQANMKQHISSFLEMKQLQGI